MTPIELLEKGIKQQDWTSIVDAYKGLTGKTIKLPRSSQKGGRVNRFVDSKQDLEQYYKDRPSERKMYHRPPTERREKTELVEIQCVRCSKMDNVSPKLLPDSMVQSKGYVCNRCAG